MNRQEALDFLVENVEDWSLHGLADIPQEGCWFFSTPLSPCEIVMINYAHGDELPITKQDWLEAKSKVTSKNSEMKNADMPAMPVDKRFSCGELSVSTNECTGLTKREHFAGLAMQGIIASGNLTGPETLAGEIELFKRVSIAALSYADALLEELSK